MTASSREIPRRVAVAGATGNAGREIVRTLLARGIAVRALARNPAKLEGLDGPLEIRRLQLTDPEAVRGCLDGVDAVISALGKTNQRGGAGRRAVDVNANLSLLEEAKRAGTGKFGFVSVAMARPDHPVAMVRMKGEVERAIEESGLEYVIVQPTGYFSDLWQLLETAKGGTFWIVGDGKMRFNPIHPADVAEAIVKPMLVESLRAERIPVGGPEIFDSFELAELCERVLDRRLRIRRVPLWAARAMVAVLRPFSQDLWQMGNFFVGSVAYAKRELGNDAALPAVGTLRLEDYFRARLRTEAIGGEPSVVAGSGSKEPSNRQEPCSSD